MVGTDCGNNDRLLITVRGKTMINIEQKKRIGEKLTLDRRC